MRIDQKVETTCPEVFIQEREKSGEAWPHKLNANPENVERGLAKLVLVLVELIRRLLEKQAMRRIEGGSLTDREIEEMGETLMRLENKLQELKAIFGLQDEDLNINLGPLGNLM
jgi:hypothetical protein